MMRNDLNWLAACSFLWLVVGATAAASPAAELAVSSDFENGSADVQGIDQAAGTIRIRPAGDPERGWPCWWSFRVDSVEPGRVLNVEIDRTTGLLPIGTGAGSEGKPLSPSWSHPDRATFSIDDGKTWQHTEPGVTTDGRRRYSQRIDAKSVRFAWGPPFTSAEGSALIAAAVAACPQSTPFTLATTREGRPVLAVAVRSGPLADEKRAAVWIQARQHAWESGGSWVGSGLLKWWIGDDPRAVALREKAVLYYVPLMDVDSVATGNGGKGQRPQDHNRDWSAEPHFPEVAAAQKKLKELDAQGTLALFADLHNPAPGDREPYFFVSPDEILSDVGKRNVALFTAAGRAEITGPLKLRDRTQPSGSSYSPKWREISKNWVTLNCHPGVVAVTLETAWNTPHSTTTGYETVGRQLGLTIEAFLKARENSESGK